PGLAGVTITNQFGAVLADLKSPEYLLVPSAKSTTAPPGPIVPAIDHYTCYKVLRARFTRPSIGIDDQFGSWTVDVKKPARLCIPANKNNEGVPDPASNLLCYQVRSS